jgi:hypothetical protein
MKKLVVSMLALCAASTAIFTKKEARTKIFSRLKQIKNKSTGTNEHYLPIDKAGQPEPTNEENNRMVAEGSTFGVEYYNKWKHDS